MKAWHYFEKSGFPHIQLGKIYGELEEIRSAAEKAGLYFFLDVNLSGQGLFQVFNVKRKPNGGK